MKGKDLASFAGLWKMSDKEAKNMKDFIRKLRTQIDEDVFKKLYT